MTRMMRICLVALCLSTPLAAQDLNKLLNRVPSNANVLTVIDTKALMNSPRAAAEGWSQKRNLDYQSGKVPFPPALKFAVIASEYVPTEHRNAWQVTLLEYPDKVYEDKVAKMEGSEVELIDNQYVVPSRRNMYYVQFERESWGIYSPANRQQMMRWLQYAKTNTTNSVNNYLNTAMMEGGSKGQINIAMDLTNTLDRAEILNRLQQSKVLDQNIDRVKWTGFIKDIRGIRLSLNVTNNYAAELQLDFNEDVAPYAQQLPAFVVETLSRGGFDIGDVSQWKSTARGKSLSMKGNVDSDDVKKVLSLVLPPLFMPDQDEQLSGPAAVAATSQRYFKAMNNLLNDLHTRSDRMDRDRAWQTNASWYEYTVRKIEQLPLVNVDPTLVEYTATVNAQLRMCAENLRGVNIQGKVLDSYKRKSVGYGWDGGYYGGGGYGIGGFYGGQYDNYQEVTSAKMEVAAKGANDRNAIWKQIGDATTNLRQALSSKYNLEF